MNFINIFKFLFIIIFLSSSSIKSNEEKVIFLSKGEMYQLIGGMCVTRPGWGCPLISGCPESCDICDCYNFQYCTYAFGFTARDCWMDGMGYQLACICPGDPPMAYFVDLCILLP